MQEGRLVGVQDQQDWASKKKKKKKKKKESPKKISKRLPCYILWEGMF